MEQPSSSSVTPRATTRSLLLAGAALLVAAAGCDPTYAPPMRMGLGRLPESLGSGGRAVQISCGYPYGPVTEGRFEIALHRKLDLDFGMFWMLAGVRNLGTLMGSLALHWEAVRRGPFRLRLTGGVGIGRGGEYSDPDTNEATDPSLAGGALFGVDFGFRINRYVGLYIGNRYHVADTPETPVTQWGYHVFGVHAEVAGFYFAAESGVAYYFNRMDHELGPTIIHITFGYRWGPEAPTALHRREAPRPTEPRHVASPPSPPGPPSPHSPPGPPSPPSPPGPPAAHPAPLPPLAVPVPAPAPPPRAKSRPAPPPPPAKHVPAAAPPPPGALPPRTPPGE